MRTRCTFLIYAVATLILGCLIGTGSAMAEPRIALVIGNSNYDNVPKILNPVNDSQAISKLLKSANFDVTEADDLTHAQMLQTINAFVAKAAKSGPDTVLLLFYAGHVDLERIRSRPCGGDYNW